MIPQLVWYQSNTHLYVQVIMNQVKEIDLKKLDYKLKGQFLSLNYLDYNLEQELLEEVATIEIKSNSRFIHFVITKEQPNFWTYLFKDRMFNKSYVKVDWNNWVDEDEEEDEVEQSQEPKMGSNGFDIKQFNEMMKAMNAQKGQQVDNQELENDDNDLQQDSDNSLSEEEEDNS